MGTYTASGIYLPDVGETGWGDLVNANFTRWDLISLENQGIFSPLRFGAKFDGQTDDTDAINDCLAATAYYEIGEGYPAPLGWPDIVLGNKAAPERLTGGGVGGTILLPVGTALISETIEPTLGGGVGTGHAAFKTINWVGNSKFATMLRWAGDPNEPMLALGLNGAHAYSTLTATMDDTTDPVTFSVRAGTGGRFPSATPFTIAIDYEQLEVTSRVGDTMIANRAQNGSLIAKHAAFITYVQDDLQATSSDNFGDIVGFSMDGNGTALNNMLLIETNLISIRNVGFTNSRWHGLWSRPDVLSGKDYGSINLTMERCIFGIGHRPTGAPGDGRMYGKGAWFEDPHAIRILYNEFAAGVRGNLVLRGGGGNEALIQGNSFEGVTEQAGHDDEFDPNGLPVYDLAGTEWDFEQAGNHSVSVRLNAGASIRNNAWEDSMTSPTKYVREFSALYLHGGALRVAENSFGLAGSPGYVIKLDGDTYDVRIENNFNIGAIHSTLDLRTWAPVGDFQNVYVGGNVGLLLDYTEPLNDSIVFGPDRTFVGFSPKLYVGSLMDAQAAGGFPGRLEDIQGTLEVAGQLVASRGITAGIVSGAAPVDGDLESPLDSTLLVRGKVQQPTQTSWRTDLIDPAEPGNVEDGQHFYLITYKTAAGESDGATFAANLTEVFDQSVNGKVVVTLPRNPPPGVTAYRIYRNDPDSADPAVTRRIAEVAVPATAYTDNIAHATMLLGVDVPAVNTSDTVNRIYARVGGVQRFADLNSTSLLTGTTTWNPGSLATGATDSTTVTVTGATIGDSVAVGFDVAVPAGMLLVGSVTAGGVVTVTLCNVSAANPTNLDSGTLRADVWHH